MILNDKSVGIFLNYLFSNNLEFDILFMYWFIVLNKEMIKLKFFLFLLNYYNKVFYN